MATIYRFIIEQKEGRGSSGRKSGGAKKGAAKKGRNVSIFGGEKGGVEHNRKMRAINPLINRATHGVWEKGMRVGRAGMGLITRNTETGKIGFSNTAIAIIIALCIQLILKQWKWNQQRAEYENKQNFKSLENGTSAVRGSYDIAVNVWTGGRTYNQNK